MSINNTGSADNPAEIDNDQVRVPLRVLILGGIVLVLALVIGTQVVGVLYAILFPPAPPLPAGVVLVTHTNTAHGVDDWLYNSTAQPCAVVQFYIDQGLSCRTPPSTCLPVTAGEEPPFTPNAHIARCIVDQKFSIFAQQWQVILSTGISPDLPSQFRLIREVYWTGAVPPAIQP